MKFFDDTEECVASHSTHVCTVHPALSDMTFTKLSKISLRNKL